MKGNNLKPKKVLNKKIDIWSLMMKLLERTWW